MKVYVVLTWWDTDQVDGRMALGAWADRDAARAAMKADVDRVKKCHADMDRTWDDEFSTETEDFVYLASGVVIPYETTIYSWDVCELDVQ